MAEPAASGYHHGDLWAALLRAAEAHVRREGPASLSLRGLAREVGVSHAAPAHHFGSKRGLLTALAAQGHALLAERMAAATAAGGSFADVGVAYVAFATEHPAHFAVMFSPDLLDLDDPALGRARAGTLGALAAGARGVGGEDLERSGAAAVAAWSLVHGLAVLHLTGNLAEAGVRDLVGTDDPAELARRATSMLFGRGSGA